MARQIIILDRTPFASGAASARVVFWLAVASGKESPKPGFQSAVQGPDQPSAGELSALQTGTVIELQSSWQFPSSYTLAQAKTFLELAFADAQAALTANPPGQLYGQNWDGTTWGAGA